MLSPLHAARTACEHSNGTLDPLSLQKILYLAQLFSIGTGEKAIDANFIATDFGPVIQSVYRHTNIYGIRPIKYIPFHAEKLQTDEKSEQLIREVTGELAHKNLAWLVGQTQWRHGAWAKAYRPNIKIMITDCDILEEYRNRQSHFVTRCSEHA